MEVQVVPASQATALKPEAVNADPGDLLKRGGR
jgi:hypothetical protein